MLKSLVAYLHKQTSEEELGSNIPEETRVFDGVRVHFWHGARGGGYAPPPPWVPPNIRKQYQEAWEAEDRQNVIDSGYDPDDDPLGRSETQLDNASGWTIVAPKVVEGADPEIVYFVTKPIPFKLRSQTFYIWGGISGV